MHMELKPFSPGLQTVNKIIVFCTHVWRACGFGKKHVNVFFACNFGKKKTELSFTNIHSKFGGSNQTQLETSL